MNVLMKSLQKVIASQLISGDDWELKKELDSPEGNHNKFLSLYSKTGLEIIKKYENAEGEGVLVRSGQKFALLNLTLGHIDYYMQFEVGKVAGVKAATQIAIWSRGNSWFINQNNRIPADLFFNKLLPLTGVIAADREQTTDGMRFWQKRLVDAKSLGLFIYIHDRSRNTLTPLHTYAEIDEALKENWGWGGQFAFQRAIISQRELALNK